MNLAELIRSTKGDRTYAQLAQATTNSPSRQRWQQMATQEPKTFLDPETIRAMATVLGVTQRAVLLAVAESLELDIDRGMTRLEHLLPSSLDRLTPDEEAAVLGVLRALLKHHEPTGGSPVVQLRDCRRTSDVSEVDSTLAASEGEDDTLEFESHEDQP